MLQMVMFHAFKGRDLAAESQIALLVRSIGIHYPEAEIILLTNADGAQATLPAAVAVVSQPIDLSRLMFERAVAYRNYAKSVAAGMRVVFLDTDMLVIRRFDELLAPGADIAVTVRQILPAPVNGGLIVANMERRDRVVGFFERFVDAFQTLTEDEKRWDGDQIVLRILLDAPVARLREISTVMRGDLVVRFAPAQVFNHTPRRLMLRLGLFRPGARLLHFKGGRKERMGAYARRYLSGGVVAYLRFGRSHRHRSG